MSNLNSWSPHLMMGAPTARLSPLIPPPNIETEPVGIEVAPGIGVSLDGETLLVGDAVPEGLTTITGHVAGDSGQVLYPQRDFKVQKGGDDVDISSHFAPQHYTLHKGGATTNVHNQDPRNTYDIEQTPSGLESKCKYEVNHFIVTRDGDKAHSQGYDPYHTADILFDGASAQVNSTPERTFTWKKTDHGLHMEGPTKPQSFDLTYEPGGFTLQGYYPQQKFVVQYPA